MGLELESLLSLAVPIALLGLVLIGWLACCLVRGRALIRESLSKDGFAVHELKLRWLTRGPFMDMTVPGSTGNRGEYLFHVVAVDRGGSPRTGYVRWHVRLPWQPADRWAVLWDPVPSQPKGLSSGWFHALVLLLVLIVGSLLLLFGQQFRT